MIHVKRFIDKVSLLESKQNKDLVLPAHEARSLRDEISKLISDLYEMKKDSASREVVQIEVKGGTFK